jgi:hypothetical protein
MVHNSWRRPKTSLGLPTNNNNSSIHQNSTDTQPDARRATQEYLSRPSFGELLARKSTTELSSLYDRSGLSQRERTLWSRVEEAKSIVRKALHGNREMRPVPELSSTDSGLTVNTTPSSHTQSSRSPSAHSSRARQRESSTIPRPFSRMRSIRERTRRNAVGAFSFRSGKPTVSEPTKEMIDQMANTPFEQQILPAVPYSEPNQRLRPETVAGAGARAAVAAARDPAVLSTPENLSQLQMSRHRTPDMSNIRSIDVGFRPINFGRSDTMVTTRSRQYESPDNGQRGYDEITQCEPAATEKVLIGKCPMPDLSVHITLTITQQIQSRFYQQRYLQSSLHISMTDLSSEHKWSQKRGAILPHPVQFGDLLS